ncbi:hypothetical protein EXIGLDRAFT_779624 [Exidia glandulosa HHB12029]|uniref:Uncharacterized protein n=1 Tax=Exidia glandulosa HHB12029 TaxID=1314781 RepID=A0A165BZ81_EXIGL|nr:hypothetical protein EXIGLDRAFT_779624 [Exidia glandulosa HHB12029]
MPLEPSTCIDAGAWQSPAIDLLVALLKAAREATDDVPIVKQILGAAVHIIEYAEKMRGNRRAMLSLAEKAATFAQQIQQIVEGCVVNDILQARLQRLHTVFDGIESFARPESAVRGRFKRTVRTYFIVPRQIERLRGDLENEIQVFLVRVCANDSFYGAS